MNLSKLSLFALTLIISSSFLIPQVSVAATKSKAAAPVVQHILTEQIDFTAKDAKTGLDLTGNESFKSGDVIILTATTTRNHMKESLIFDVGLGSNHYYADDGSCAGCQKTPDYVYLNKTRYYKNSYSVPFSELLKGYRFVIPDSVITDKYGIWLSIPYDVKIETITGQPIDRVSPFMVHSSAPLYYLQGAPYFQVTQTNPPSVQFQLQSDANIINGIGNVTAGNSFTLKANPTANMRDEAPYDLILQGIDGPTPDGFPLSEVNLGTYTLGQLKKGASLTVPLKTIGFQYTLRVRVNYDPAKGFRGITDFVDGLGDKKIADIIISQPHQRYVNIITYPTASSTNVVEVKSGGTFKIKATSTPDIANSKMFTILLEPIDADKIDDLANGINTEIITKQISLAQLKAGYTATVPGIAHTGNYVLDVHEYGGSYDDKNPIFYLPYPNQAIISVNQAGKNVESIAVEIASNKDVAFPKDKKTYTVHVTGKAITSKHDTMWFRLCNIKTPDDCFDPKYLHDKSGAIAAYADNSTFISPQAFNVSGKNIIIPTKLMASGTYYVQALFGNGRVGEVNIYGEQFSEYRSTVQSYSKHTITIGTSTEPEITQSIDINFTSPADNDTWKVGTQKTFTWNNPGALKDTVGLVLTVPRTSASIYNPQQTAFLVLSDTANTNGTKTVTLGSGIGLTQYSYESPAPIKAPIQAEIYWFKKTDPNIQSPRKKIMLLPEFTTPTIETSTANIAAGKTIDVNIPSGSIVNAGKYIYARSIKNNIPSSAAYVMNLFTPDGTFVKQIPESYGTNEDGYGEGQVQIPVDVPPGTYKLQVVAYPVVGLSVQGVSREFTVINPSVAATAKKAIQIIPGKNTSTVTVKPAPSTGAKPPVLPKSPTGSSSISNGNGQTDPSQAVAPYINITPIALWTKEQTHQIKWTTNVPKGNNLSLRFYNVSTGASTLVVGAVINDGLINITGGTPHFVSRLPDGIYQIILTDVKNPTTVGTSAQFQLLSGLKSSVTGSIPPPASNSQVVPPITTGIVPPPASNSQVVPPSSAGSVPTNTSSNIVTPSATSTYSLPTQTQSVPTASGSYNPTPPPASGITPPSTGITVAQYISVGTPTGPWIKSKNQQIRWSTNVSKGTGLTVRLEGPNGSKTIGTAIINDGLLNVTAAAPHYLEGVTPGTYVIVITSNKDSSIVGRSDSFEIKRASDVTAVPTPTAAFTASVQSSWLSKIVEWFK